jgi:hypothetical protein
MCTARAIGDVVEDREREGVGTLEDHADALAEFENTQTVDVAAVEQNRALDAGSVHEFVHPVEAAQQG